MSISTGEGSSRKEFPDFSDLGRSGSLYTQQEPEVIEAGILNDEFVRKTIDTIVSNDTPIDPTQRDEIDIAIRRILTSRADMVSIYGLLPQNALLFLSGFVPTEAGIDALRVDLTSTDHLLSYAKYLETTAE